MDNRQKIHDDVMALKYKNILLEFATGTGKSKIALDKLNHHNLLKNVLVVVPYKTAAKNISDEFIKWGYNEELDNAIIICYQSLHKYAGRSFSAVIYDEAHHITDRSAEYIRTIRSNMNILLSATIHKHETLNRINRLFNGLYTYKVDQNIAIEQGILPEPTIFLTKLTLDDNYVSQEYVINDKLDARVHYHSYDEWCSNRKRIFFSRDKHIIRCTQLEYYRICCDVMDLCKYKIDNAPLMQRRWYENRLKQEGGRRLKFLSSLKNNLAKKILNSLKDKRVLTFCTSIEQTKELSGNHINSKNSNSDKVLQKFNDMKINHITACSMLNEAVSLSSCQYGLFVDIKVSQIAEIQRFGRILRHEHPMVIFLYYEDTKEHEVINEIASRYNDEYIVHTDARNLIKDIEYEDSY